VGAAPQAFQTAHIRRNCTSWWIRTNRINETDKGDNAASQPVLGPDLAITAAEAQPDLGDQVLLHAQVRNRGASSTQTTTLAYHWPNLASSAQMTATVPPLAVGAAVTLTLPWHFGDLAAGAHLLVADVNGGDFPELNLTNNVVTVTLGVQPDLAISPNDLVVGDVRRTLVPITLTVHNLGVITATDVLVGSTMAGKWTPVRRSSPAPSRCWGQAPRPC